MKIKAIFLVILISLIAITVMSNPPEENKITDLEEKWNIFSIPFDEALSKENISVLYNEIEYSWSDAVDEGIIIDCSYGWDRQMQQYCEAEEFNPDEGYWIYAYEECSLYKYIYTPSLKLYERWLNDNGYATVEGEIIWGQQFTIGTTGENEDFELESTIIKLKKNEENEPGIIFVDVYDVNSSGYPNNHLSTGEIDGDTIPDEATEINVTMSFATLNKDTMYVFIVTAPYATEPIYMRCICDEEEDPHDLYDGGYTILSWDSGENWITNECSFYFKIYGTG